MHSLIASPATYFLSSSFFYLITYLSVHYLVRVDLFFSFRNGHKYTHESRKPHACHFCDKSYSDSRSLRRHYENAHPEENERWMLLCQATNGDTSALSIAAAAAAALLSSSAAAAAAAAAAATTGLDAESSLSRDGGGGNADGNSDNDNNASSLAILNALSNSTSASSSSSSAGSTGVVSSASVNKLIELGNQTGLSPAALVALVASTGSTSGLSSSLQQLDRSNSSTCVSSK